MHRRFVDTASRNLMFSDPPVHPRLRALVGAAFTAKAIARWAPTVQASTDEVLSLRCSSWCAWPARTSRSAGTPSSRGASSFRAWVRRIATPASTTGPTASTSPEATPGTSASASDRTSASATSSLAWKLASQRGGPVRRAAPDLQCVAGRADDGVSRDTSMRTHEHVAADCLPGRPGCYAFVYERVS